MSYGLLHLNDYSVELFNAEDIALSTSAQVIFQPNTLITGANALAQSRINPTLAYSKHWQQLDQQGRNLPTSNFRHHADIAYYQLGQWLTDFKHTPLVVASSFGYSANQYALLAGLLQAHNQKQLSFCDSGLLYASGYIDAQPSLETSIYFLDFTLHTARLLAFRQQHGQLILTQQWDFVDIGVLDLQNAWLKIVAQECIRQTRYDPLHSATSEQRLYSQLPNLTDDLNQASDIELEIDARKVTLKKADILACSASFRKEITAQVGSDPLLLSPSAQFYSGLEGIAVTNQHLNKAASTQQEFFKQQSNLKYHTQLPQIRANRESPKILQSEAVSSHPVTHLLSQHRAQTLQTKLELYHINSKLVLQLADKDAKQPCAAEFIPCLAGWEIKPYSKALLLNDTPLTSTSKLILGDKISTPNADNNFTCISVIGALDGT